MFHTKLIDKGSWSQW